MSKDYLAINAGRVVFTKFDPDTGALSIMPEDKRICTEACDGITRSKTLNTYEIADGNSNYPAGIYDTGMTYAVGINFTTLNTATLAFLQGTAVTKGSGNIKEVASLVIPTESPYEVELLGNTIGDLVVLDTESNLFALEVSAPSAKQFSVASGVAGTKQAMEKSVTAVATTAGTATITITAAGSAALVGGKAVEVNLTDVDADTNADEIRSVLLSDPDVSAYFDIGGVAAEIVLTRKIAAITESEAFDFTLDTVIGIVLGSTTSVAGVAAIPSKLTFNLADAGSPIMVEYTFEATEVESYDINENGTHPAVQVEIIHETMSVDKTKKYKNNSIVNKMTLTGNIDENLARQHAPTTLNFNAIKPLGSNVVRNKKTSIPL